MHVYTVVYVMLNLINLHGGDYSTDGCVGSMIWASKVDILFMFFEPCWMLVLKSLSWTVL